MRSSLFCYLFALIIAILAISQDVSAAAKSSSKATKKPTTKGTTKGTTSKNTTSSAAPNSNAAALATNSTVPPAVIALIAKLATDPGVNGGVSVVDPVKNQSSMTAANAIYNFGTSAGALDFWYLQWARSYAPGDAMQFYLIQNAGQTAPKAITSITLLDHYGKTPLGTIAQNVALPTTVAAQTPFILGAPWQVPASLPAQFDFDGWFMIVMTYANAQGQTETKDRLVHIPNLTATPGGAVNPVLANAVGMSKYGAVSASNLEQINLQENGTDSAMPSSGSNLGNSTSQKAPSSAQRTAQFSLGGVALGAVVGFAAFKARY